MTSPSPSALVRACFDAYLHRDRAAIERLLADDFRFTSPYDDAIDREAYFARCWPTNELFRRHEIESLLEDGDEAFVRYRLELTTGEAFRNTERFTFENGRIGSIEVYFGACAGNADGEASVRAIVEARAAAIRSKDVDGVMRLCASGIESFDVVDPLGNRGAATVRRRLESWYAAYDGPIGCEVRGLTVAARGDLAFAHSLHRFSGTLKAGAPIDMWVRDTLGLRNVDGDWRIVHEHMSVPFDPDTGMASLGLVP